MGQRDDVFAAYRRYLDGCNTRTWTDVAGFVADVVIVNGRTITQQEYIADIEDTVRVFPDYRWTIRRLLWEAGWLSVHLHDTGTRMGAFLGAPGDGSVVDTDEFAMYRIQDGRIVELEGTADDARLARITTDG